MSSADSEIKEHIEKLADPAVAFFHARRLADIGSKAILPLVKKLQETAQNPTEPSYGISAWCIKALSDIGTEAVPSVMTLLTDKNAQVRWAAASVLGKIGSKGSIPELIRVLKHDRNENVRWMAASALSSHINESDVVKAFVEAMNDKSNYVRWIVVSGISEVKNPTFEVFIITLSALKDSDDKIRSAAFKFLDKFPKFFSYLSQLSQKNKELFYSICKMLDENYYLSRKETSE